MSKIIARFIESPKDTYYPCNNTAYNRYYGSYTKFNKKHGNGDNFEIIKCSEQYDSRRIYSKVIKKGYWAFYSKGGNIIECGTYADNGNKFGIWYGYYGGKKDLQDRLKYETNYIDDKIVGIQRFYKKTSDYKSVYLWKEIKYDDNGDPTGFMTKYNESKQIIFKTFVVDDIIIQEKYGPDGNILIHREFNIITGRPVNVWFVNKCIPQVRTKMYNLLMEYYKKDFEEKFPEKEKNFSKYNYDDILNHVYEKYRYKSCLDEIKYIKTFNQEEKSIDIIISDKNDNIICEINKKLKN
jgi:hypothetical protein